jgi:hypothetical protein
VKFVLLTISDGDNNNTKPQVKEDRFFDGIDWEAMAQVRMLFSLQ